MGFNPDYIKKFQSVAQNITKKYEDTTESFFEIGEHVDSPYPSEAIIEVMNLWVDNIDRLLHLSKGLSQGELNKRFKALYAQRGITYDEYYYLFSDHISEDEFLDTPAYLFTQTYSRDLRDRRFSNLSFTPENYKDYILSLDLVPSHFFLRSLQARFPAEALFAHTYCVAKTRSGKTEFLKLVIYNLIKRKYKGTSLLILDPHGEFAREIRRLKIVQENLDDFVYLDPTIDTENTPVFNPLQVKFKSTEKLAYSSDTFLDAFEQLLKDQNITGNMRRLLRHCIYTLLYHDGTTMMDLLILLQTFNRNRSKKEPEFTEEEARLINMGLTVPDPLTRRFFEHGWKSVDTRTINAVVERIDGILSHPIVRRFIVGESSFDLGSYLNSGKIVVVNLDFTKLGNIGSEAIGRLIVSEAQNISAQRSVLPKHERPRTIIFMDECQRFVSAAIERALSEFAKFNTYLFLAHQYIDQIDNGMVKAMLSNTENKIVGRNSAATMTAISSDIGVSKDKLLEVKKYQFYLKSGDRAPYLFKSSDMLLDKVGNSQYITEGEAIEMVDSHMIRHYYQPVQNTGFRFEAVNQKHTIAKPIDPPTDLSINLDDDDF